MSKVFISGVVDAVAMEAGVPSHPIAPGGPPPGIWPSPGHPAHPIAPGGPPPGIWPSPGVPTHPIYIPIKPPENIPGLSPEHPIYIPVYPSQGPGFPTHPIAPGGPPLGIWPDVGAIKEAIKSFLHGNLPPSTQPTQPTPTKA